MALNWPLSSETGACTKSADVVVVVVVVVGSIVITSWSKSLGWRYGELENNDEERKSKPCHDSGTRRLDGAGRAGGGNPFGNVAGWNEIPCSSSSYVCIAMSLMMY
jgi:hypothetical protein